MAVLVLAEKPSVSQAIAAALGVKGRRDGYIEGNGYIISWCVGHLVELANADCYDARYSKWAREDLPILPAPWKFTVSPGTKKQFKIIQSLMERSDVSELIEATDAGREGELIFRLVYREAGCKKPFKRLWISSMEDSAIRAGFENLMPGEKYDALYEAALCRAKADWLVGINGTRLFTTLYRGKTLNVGRVMTPTLALLTEREQAVTGFQKEKFYTVDLDCGAFCLSSGRFKSRTDAEKLRKLCMGKKATVQSAQRQERAEKPPKLYDLTTLQREANRIYGYTAQQTLDYIQLLYEKKLATYPRTDSRYLTEDMAGHLPALCRSVAAAFPFASGFDGAVEAAQVVCNAKVSDHHAIIPTKEAAKANLEELPTGERNILSLIAARLLCAVCPEKHKFADTAVACICADTEFTAKGRMEISAGWKGLEQAFQDTLKSRPEAEKTQALLPELSRGETVAVKEAVLHEGTTSPPPRYTEDSLLAAMETAGAGDMPEDAERKGLGTPATRAATLEKLVSAGFVQRKKKQLIPTEKGTNLILVLPDNIKSPMLTAEWESMLKQVERGGVPAKDFMDGIADMIRALVREHAAPEERFAGLFPDAKENGREAVGTCPRCGGTVYEGKKGFFCDNRDCAFALWKDNRFFSSKKKSITKSVAAALLKEGRVSVSGLYSEKTGKTYDAVVLLDDTGGKYVNFRLEFPAKKGRGK